jgi:hypothetical protein
MDNTNAQTLQSLKDLNASMKDFNGLLEELIQSRREDKLSWLKALNTDLSEVNAILLDLLESRKKDALVNELAQTTSPSA